MFELKRDSAYGSFSLRLNIAPSETELIYIDKIASSFLNQNTIIRFNPPSSKEDSGASIHYLVPPDARFLGQHPVEKISMGGYKEPEEGVYIQILDLPKNPITAAVRELRLLVPISVQGWANILRGNFWKVKFAPSIAFEIMSVLKENEIYAKLVQRPSEKSAQHPSDGTEAHLLQVNSLLQCLENGAVEKEPDADRNNGGLDAAGGTD